MTHCMSTVHGPAEMDEFGNCGSKEVVGGFWVIDAPGLDVARELAAEGSKACRGRVEVRPFDGLA